MEIKERFMNKKFIFVGVIIILCNVLLSCASFGAYGNIINVNERVFNVEITVPPIAGGGNRGSNLQSAIKYSAKEVQKKGGNYFIIIEIGYSEQQRDVSFGPQYVSHGKIAYPNNPVMASTSTSVYSVLWALPEEEEDIREFASEKGYQIYSAEYVLQK